MKKEAFKLLHDGENSWWYRGRKLAVEKVLSKFARSGGRILDFGAGFGGMSEALSGYGTVFAFEPDKEAGAVAAEKGYAKIFSSPEEIFSGEKFRGIALFDVLEHMDDDSGFLKTARENLEDGGYIILTVPAYQWLWSIHDINHHHKRRYSRGEIIRLLKKEGFSVSYASYWNMLLFIPVAVVRLFGGTGESSFAMSKLADSVFYAVVFLESLLMPKIVLPFGTGLVVFAEKK